MTNWKTFEITSIYVEHRTFIRFYLNGQVDYIDHKEFANNFIHCSDGFPFNNYSKGEYLEIDLDKTCSYSHKYVFRDNSMVKNKYGENIYFSSREEEQALVKKQVEELERQTERLDSLSWEVSNLEGIIKAGGKELERKNAEIDELKNNLEQIKEAFKNKIEENEQLSQELNSLRLENKETKKALGNSREEVINYTLNAKKIKLENFIQQSGIDRLQVRNLRRFYQQLIKAREECKQDDINVAKQNIDQLEDNLLDRGISIQNFQSLCRKCEKIVKLELEQENLYKERFEARQEVVLYNNNR